MLNIRTIATLSVAIVLGLIAVIVLNGYLGSSRYKQQAAVAGVTPVVVAALPISRGAALQPFTLKVVNYPQGAAPLGAFGSVSQLVGGNATQRLALRDIGLNEPILPAAVSGPGGRLTMSSAIQPGMQAVAVKDSDVAGVGGFLLPGDHVDVLLTRSVGQAGNQNMVTQVVAENVQVMGVDQSDNNASDKPAVARSITLEVTPAQAQAITLGQAGGAISLSLRHVGDAEQLAQRATTTAQLGFFAPPSTPRPPAPTHVAKRSGETMFGAGTVRVTRVTDTTSYRLGGG